MIFVLTPRHRLRSSRISLRRWNAGTCGRRSASTGARSWTDSTLSGAARVRALGGVRSGGSTEEIPGRTGGAGCRRQAGGTRTDGRLVAPPSGRGPSQRQDAVAYMQALSVAAGNAGALQFARDHAKAVARRVRQRARPDGDRRGGAAKVRVIRSPAGLAIAVLPFLNLRPNGKTSTSAMGWPRNSPAR